MSKTKIEWTDRTWNPVRGCSRVSEGCRNCYAERMASRFSRGIDEIPGPRIGQTDDAFHGFAIRTPSGPRWTGKVELIKSKLREPLTWKKPQRVFVNSMSDLFHEELPDEAIDRVFAVMAVCPHITFQILTKRPERMAKYLHADSFAWRRVYDQIFPPMIVENYKGGLLSTRNTHWPLPNVWLGVSVENQPTADARIPILLRTPAAIRIVSYEPALGPVDFSRWLAVDGDLARTFGNTFLDWIIAGGESGPGARPPHPDWFRQVRDQCIAADVPFFFKQWGEHAPHPGKCFYKGPIPEFRAPNENGMVRLGKKKAGALLDGREWKQFPPFPVFVPQSVNVVRSKSNAKR